MRGNVKDAAQELVPSIYGVHQIPLENNARKNSVTNLLSKMNYIFPRANVFQHVPSIQLLHTNEPCRHPAIIAVMRKYFLTDNKSPRHVLMLD